jgi:hypothetical protein
MSTARATVGREHCSWPNAEMRTERTVVLSQNSASVSADAMILMDASVQSTAGFSSQPSGTSRERPPVWRSQRRCALWACRR